MMECRVFHSGYGNILEYTRQHWGSFLNEYSLSRSVNMRFYSRIMRISLKKNPKARQKRLKCFLAISEMPLMQLPELGLRGGSPSWRAPRGCTRLGNGTFQRHAPARAAGRWWRWCGCACVSSWAAHPCLGPETCLHRSLYSSSARSVPDHICLQIGRSLWESPGKNIVSFYFLHMLFDWTKWMRTTV